VMDLPAAVGALQPVYFHLLMVGWISQLIFGVVFWMFPKYSAERPRGSEGLGWATYGLLNMGLLLRAVGEPLVAVQPNGGTGWLLAASAVLQLLAGYALGYSPSATDEPGQRHPLRAVEFRTGLRCGLAAGTAATIVEAVAYPSTASSGTGNHNGPASDPSHRR
jgi:hypothetical protein